MTADEHAPSDEVPAEKKEENPDDKVSSTTSSSIYSLSSTVTRNVSIGVSALILISHGLLLWGQTGQLWGLFTFNEVSVDASGASKELESGSMLVNSFSYIDMVVELWHQPYAVTKLTAVLLLSFSAIWPHLKLVLLHLYYYIPAPSTPRRSALYWLGSIGKMSLADICATCMIFMLMNLSATIQTGNLVDQAKAMVQQVVPDIVNETQSKLSNSSLSFLETMKSFNASEGVADLADVLQGNGDGALFDSILGKACAFATNSTCDDDTVEIPVITGNLPAIISKCEAKLLRDGNCAKCECIVTNVLQNGALPGNVTDKVKDKAEGAIDKAEDAISGKAKSFAKALTSNLGNLTESLPSLDFTGTLTIGLLVKAYPAFLSFTFGVILSIISSIYVEKIEEKDCISKNRGVSSISAFLEASGLDKSKPSFLFWPEDAKMFSKSWKILLSLATIPLTFMALWTPMFDGEITGLLEQLIVLQVAGVTTALNYSMSIIDCVVNVNDGTGYGWTFTVFYGILMLAAPLLRALFLTILGIVPMPPKWHIKLAHLSNSVGGFIGWEPFFICAVLLMFELPSLTGTTIISEEQCNEIASVNVIARLVEKWGLMTNPCFIMYFTIMPMFALFIVAWVFLTGFNALAWKAVLRKYDVFGNYEQGQRGGPYCGCRSCCFCPGIMKLPEEDNGNNTVTSSKAIRTADTEKQAAEYSNSGGADDEKSA